MRTRWSLFGIVIGITLAVGVGAAFASGSALPRAGAATVGQATGDGDGTDGWAAMEAMHDSPWMEQMHAQMPADRQQQCDALHEQMQQQSAGQTDGSGDSGMMGGSGDSGMMGGSGGSGMMGG